MPLPDYHPTNGSDIVQIRRDIRALQIAARSQGGTAPSAVNRYTGTHTIGPEDVGGLVQIDSAMVNALRFPADADAVIAVGRSGSWVQWGVGVTTLVAEPGVTIRSTSTSLQASARYSGGTWIKTGANEFWVTGDLVP